MKYKIADFLNKYDIILFDMDGVITSEQRYWDASALTIFQCINKSVDVKYAMDNVQKIRSDIFCNDKIIVLLKERGVNSNWDLTYVTLGIAEMLGTTDFKKVYEYMADTGYDAFGFYEFLGKNSQLGERNGDKYNYLVDIFQEWYLGNALFEKMFRKTPTMPGKSGLINGEVPIISVEKTQEVFNILSENKKILGIGTGRVHYEILGPLENWNIMQYFDKNRLITYSNIQEAEEEIPNVALTKPHPYIFLKGMLGIDYDNKKIIDGNYDNTNIEKTLVVGDAGADLFSAKSAGMDFAAVLTGVTGAEFFRKNNADYILNSIEDLIEKV